MVKIVGLAIVRTGTDIDEPVPCTVANDLSSFGFFQRPVSHQRAGRRSVARSRRCTRREKTVDENEFDSVREELWSLGDWGRALVPELGVRVLD